jgi:hypothetical protein
MSAAQQPGGAAGQWASGACRTCCLLILNAQPGEWGLGSIAETVELVVSELATNAVKVSAGIGSSAPGDAYYGMAPRCIALFLACDRRRVLVQIWDGDPGPPQPADVDENAESGRGLLLVEALSADWGWYWPEAGEQGKWVWATIAERDAVLRDIQGEPVVPRRMR